MDQAEPIFFASDYRAACVRKLGELCLVISESIPVFGHFLRYMIYRYVYIYISFICILYVYYKSYTISTLYSRPPFFLNENLLGRQEAQSCTSKRSAQSCAAEGASGRPAGIGFDVQLIKLGHFESPKGWKGILVLML